MHDSKKTSIKKRKNNNNNESRKENKHITLNEDSFNIKAIQKKLSNQYDKNCKPLLFNNQNHIDSINIINNNTNYKNIILNNMLTPSKKILKEKNSSRNKKNNIKIERNILFDKANSNKNFHTLSQNKQKGINNNNNNNNAFKLLVNNQEQEIMNEVDTRYKLILYEKNNLINKLKNEVEYYKNFYHNINMNMNIILPNNNNTIEANNNRISLGLNDKKNIENENTRNRIKNIFSLPKRDIKFDNNHLMQHNINDYNTIKTFVSNKANSDTINFNCLETAKDFVPQIKNNFNTIENNSIHNNKYNNNKLLLSNDSLKNDLLFKNTVEKNSKRTLNNIFYRSNSNTIQKKGRKLKLGFQQSELTLDNKGNNNFNSIEANRNYHNNLKNKKHIIYSLNSLNSKNGSDNESDNHHNNNAISVEDNINGKFEKSNHFSNKISSSPSSLNKDMGSINMIDASNSGLMLGRNDNPDIKFNYRENFEKVKKRMNNLINNLFDLIEIQNKKRANNNNENK
jgi:hypothetical protein